MCLRPLPANVWVHDNSIASGDGAYQACQPLAKRQWVGVGSDNLLLEDNTGSSTSSAFILLGLRYAQEQQSTFTCTNVTFQRMQGSGLRLIYVQAAAAPNVVEGVVLRDLLLQRTPYLAYSPASIQITAVSGGAVRWVLMDGVRALGTQMVGLNETGLLEGVVFTNGELSTPAVGGAPNVVIGGGASAVLSHSLIGSFNGTSVSIGVEAPTQGTQVLNCTLVGVGSLGLALGSANGSLVLGNLLTPQHGTPHTTGIALDASGYATTSHAQVHGNDVRAMATGIVCGHGSSNSVSGNPGAADC